MTGTAFAQAINFLIYPFVTRLYPSADMGVFSLFLAFVTFISTIAALRYDLAIVPAPNDDEALTLVSLATRSNIVFCTVTSLVLLLFAPTVADMVRAPQLAGWLWLVGPVALVTSQVAILGYWLTRKKLYRVASTNQMLTSVSMGGTRIGAGFLGGSVWGLVISQAVGQVAALARLLLITRDDVRAPRTSTRRQLARKYRNMPLLNGPNAVVDAIRINGIPLLIGRFFSLEVVGNFSVAWTLIQAPLGLINGALSQVFFQRLAVTARGEMLPLVRSSLLRSLLIGIAPFALIFFLGPTLLPWVLGGDYHLVGAIAAALVPWLFFNLATSPVSMLFIVVQKQGVMLLHSIVYMATPLAILWLYHDDILATMTVVSLAMAGLLAGFCLLALWAAREFDRGRTPDLSLPES